MLENPNPFTHSLIGISLLIPWILCAFWILTHAHAERTLRKILRRMTKRARIQEIINRVLLCSYNARVAFPNSNNIPGFEGFNQRVEAYFREIELAEEATKTFVKNQILDAEEQTIETVSAQAIEIIESFEESIQNYENLIDKWTLAGKQYNPGIQTPRITSAVLKSYRDAKEWIRQETKREVPW